MVEVKQERKEKTMNEKTEKMIRLWAIEEGRDPDAELARVERSPEKMALYEELIKFLDELDKKPEDQQMRDLDAAIKALDDLADEKDLERIRKRSS